MRVYKRSRVAKGQARSFHLYRRRSLAWLGESSGSFTSMVSVFEMLVRINDAGRTASRLAVKVVL